jgi:hypothetical protein
MTLVPKKNISNRVADIKSARTNGAGRPSDGTGSDDAVRQEIKPEAVQRVLRSEPPRDTDEILGPETSSSSRVWPWIAVWCGVFVAVLIALGFYRLHERSIAANASIQSIRSAIFGLGFLGTPDGGSVSSTSEPGAAGATDIWDGLKNFGAGYGALQQFSTRVFSLFTEAAFFRSNWPRFVFEQHGDELMSHLTRVRDDLAALDDLSSTAGANPLFASGAVGISSDEYVSLQLAVKRARSFLDSAIPWVATLTDRHVLILFENPSELRPGGGFVGSYADMTIRSGSITGVEIHDINDADRTFIDKIIPPTPLRRLVSRWRAADANWFFDFPSSAKKVAEFMEASSLYHDRGITFDGVLGVSANVVGDLLTFAGPVTLPGHATPITASNFLAEIQAEVQAGQAQGAKNPKQILAELAPALRDRLAQLTDSQQSTLDGFIVRWASSRDIVAYFRDAEMQKFFDAYDLSGRVFAPAQNFNGDYLAVVDANVGGGKTDLVVKEKIVFQSQITEDGTVSDHVQIARTHTAPSSAPWWYRTANEAYFMVFTPQSSQLEHESGSTALSYVRRSYVGYREDADLSAVESTVSTYSLYPAVDKFEEAGKTVFGLQTTTVRGKTSELSLDYTTKLFAPPSPGGTYQFVFERQRGAAGEYDLQISAPAGYRFRENGLPVFEYASNDPPGRSTFTLTFEKAL